MNDGGDRDRGGEGRSAPDAQSQKFLRSLLTPGRALGAPRELGSTPLARRLGLPDETSAATGAAAARASGTAARSRSSARAAATGAVDRCQPGLRFRLLFSPLQTCFVGSAAVLEADFGAL